MNNKVLSAYDWFLIAGVIATNIIYSLLSGTIDVVGSVASVAGLTAEVSRERHEGLHGVSVPYLLPAVWLLWRLEDSS